MAATDKVTEKLMKKDFSQTAVFLRVDNITLFLSDYGMGFELATNVGNLNINNPDERQQRTLFALMSKLEISAAPVKVWGSVSNGKFGSMEFSALP
ncbi:hypothetical protein ACIQSO_00535 [Pseudomonas putida]|uniref:hypothetical protein n=1 Tax=Pseudomonas putida TaxID=303 RepID=UPI00383BA495